MSEEKEHPAVRVLRCFMTEMHAWEAEMLHQHSTRDWANSVEEDVQRENAGMRTKLADIFARYCEVGPKALRVQDQLHFGGAEPDYNPKQEQIVAVLEHGSKVIVETKMTHNFRFKLKYELVIVDGEWKIRDNRKRSFEFKSKWRPFPL